MGKDFLNHIFNRFLHESVIENQHTVEGAEQAWKCRLAISVALILGLLTTFMFIVRFSLEGLSHPSLILLPIAGVSFLFFPFLFVKKLNFPIFSNFLIITFGSIILPIRVLSTGGISSSTLSWFALWPILGTLLVNRKAGIFFTLLAIGEILFLVYSENLGIPFKPVQALPIVRGAVVIILVFIIFLIITRFESERMRQLNMLRENEKSLRNAHKADSLVKMADGLAHEVNNPLTIVKGNLYKLKKSLETDEDLKRMEKVEDGVERVIALIKRLQFFSKRDIVLENESFHIGEMTTNTLNRVKTLNDVEGIRFNQNVGAPTVVYGDPIKLALALEVFLINAVESLQNSDQKSKYIKILFDEDVRHYTLSVLDNGPGILSENMEKILDPFFTTKDHQNAPGLGLSLAKGIIEKHLGRLTFSSEDGQTIFSMILPKKSS